MSSNLRAIVRDHGVTAGLSLLAAVVSFGVGLASLFLAPTSQVGPTSMPSPSIVMPGGSDTKALEDVRAQLTSLRAAIDKPLALPRDTQIARQITALSADVKRLSERQDRLEAVLMSNPAKALEITLLHREVESIKTGQTVALSSLKDSVDRVYDLNKWLLGAMAVSVITLAIASFLRGDPKAG